MVDENQYLEEKLKDKYIVEQRFIDMQAELEEEREKNSNFQKQ